MVDSRLAKGVLARNWETPSPDREKLAARLLGDVLDAVPDDNDMQHVLDLAAATLAALPRSSHEGSRRSPPRAGAGLLRHCARCALQVRGYNSGDGRGLAMAFSRFVDGFVLAVEHEQIRFGPVPQ